MLRDVCARCFQKPKSAPIPPPCDGFWNMFSVRPAVCWTWIIRCIERVGKKEASALRACGALPLSEAEFKSRWTISYLHQTGTKENVD
jgi:hypothetical protein